MKVYIVTDNGGQLRRIEADNFEFDGVYLRFYRDEHLCAFFYMPVSMITKESQEE